MATDQKITYIVGEDKRLRDILSAGDVMPILEGILTSGASGAAVLNAEGEILWSAGAHSSDAGVRETMPISLEGEVVGAVSVKGEKEGAPQTRGLASVLRDALSILIKNNLKRMLAAEIHTHVVNQSYDELVETNRRLAASEAKYRELAENLEIKVRERTAELDKAHARLLQQEKMVSIGQLAAGVAHEINNPIGFVSSNLNTLGRYAQRLKDMLLFYQSAVKEGRLTDEAIKAAQFRWKEMKLDFILSDIENLIKQGLNGAERVARIVSDLKAFSHVDDDAVAPVDLNREIDKTLNVLTHEMPKDAMIVRDYSPLPLMACKPALMCQVFLNIILNAIHACGEGLELLISTGHVDDKIIIRFKDNGPGVPEKIRNRIFEPFFTTKEVGKGTGMGLTVSYDIVTAHGGVIDLGSGTEQGAEFRISLPVKGRDHA